MLFYEPVKNVSGHFVDVAFQPLVIQGSPTKSHALFCRYILITQLHKFTPEAAQCKHSLICLSLRSSTGAVWG